jgi:hypothetical protein
MTSFAAALSEPATSALLLYLVPALWLAKPRPAHDEPHADDERSMPCGEDRDAVQHG